MKNKHGMQMGPSGFGMTHGMSGYAPGGARAAGNHGYVPGPPPPAMREGGIRGGGVSEVETMPSMVVHKKRGFDEHRHGRREKGMHGMANMLENHAMSDERVAQTKMGSEKSPGEGCGVHGCGFKAKSTHGLTQHMQRKHSMGDMRRTIHGLGSSTGIGNSSAGAGSSGGSSSSGAQGSSNATGSSGQ